MYEITYYSIANPGISGQDIASILRTSRTHNASRDITGCLLFHNGQFIQILEGNKSTVDDLIAKIKKDHRHSYFYKLAEGNKEDRTFPDWTMAFREFSEGDMKSVSEVLFINNFLAFSALAEKPTHTIRSFWDSVQKLLTKDFTS